MLKEVATLERSTAGVLFYIWVEGLTREDACSQLEREKFYLTVYTLYHNVEYIQDILKVFKSFFSFLRYSDESSARDAYNRYSICDQFPGFGPASEPKHAAAGGAADVGQPAGRAPPSGLELYVGNYPHRMGRRGLKKVFGAFPFPKLRFIGFHREGRRAYCFAEADSRETFEAVLRTMNGAEVSGRRLVVRATAPAAVQADGERTEGGRRQAGQAADVPFDDFVRVAVANYPAGAEGRLEELLLPYDPVSILKNEEEEEEEEVQCCIALFRTDSDADMAVKHLNQVLFMSSYVLLLKKLSDCTEE